MADKEIKLEQMIEYGSREAVIQNLKDAGCAQDIIECCMDCMEQGKKNELLKRLEEHREDLLQKVHEEEKHIDCLDYLVYQIGRCGS
jgi:DNA-binding transcriptional MerR regulator